MNERDFLFWVASSLEGGAKTILDRSWDLPVVAKITIIKGLIRGRSLEALDIDLAYIAAWCIDNVSEQRVQLISPDPFAGY